MKKLFGFLAVFGVMLCIHWNDGHRDCNWFDIGDMLSGPLMVLLMPGCHSHGARVRSQYEESLRFLIDHDARRRGYKVSAEAHEYFCERMARRQMIAWTPCPSVRGMWQNYASSRVAV